MRVINVGCFPFSRKSQNLHAVETKISNGFTRNGHNVLNFSDRDMARARGFGSRRWGVGFANQSLRELCAMHRPELLLIGHADVIRNETLAQIRRDCPQMRVVQWNVDPLFEEGNVRRLQARVELVDATLISTAGEALRPFARPGKPVGFLPNPVDFSVESGRSDLRAALPFDLFYACGNPARPPRLVFGVEWNMNDFTAELARRCPALRMMLPGIAGNPRITGQSYQAALEQAAIGLNISRRPDYWLYSSDRIAHLAGNGLAVFTERGTGYETLFSEREMIFASSMEELAEWLNRLHAAPGERQAIAAAGRARYHALFNEQRVARYIEEVAFERLASEGYEWPTLLKDKA